MKYTIGTKQKNCIIIFTKYPEAGKVKTRLAECIGVKRTLKLYSSYVKKTLHTAKKTGSDIIVAYYPSKDKLKVIKWLGAGYGYFLQKGTDLGARMRNAFLEAFKEGYDNAVIIGCDIPELNDAILKEAFSALLLNKAVIGPAYDGGYYLIGFNIKIFLGKVFSSVDWGTENVLEQTLDKLAAKDFVSLKKLHDIDTIEDLVNSQIKGGGHVR
jgi:hypothetical protein